MKHRFLISLLFPLLVSCMPEENLPIRDVGEAPEYFIECYCTPGKLFLLSATSVLPVSKDLDIDFSKEMSISIFAGKNIPLLHSIYILPGSDFIYNYGSQERLLSTGLDSLFLSITTANGKHISASTIVPSAINIYSNQLNGNEASIRFYTSDKSEENYYIYAAEVISNDTILSKEVCYLDYSDESRTRLAEKSLALSKIGQAEKIIVSLKRITRANYDYQISLSVANSANQSSITTPVPLKGNLSGALGIFTCYTEDRQTITP